MTLRYAGVQGIYFMAFLTVMSFAPVSLLARGFYSGQIGVLLAVGSIIGAVFQAVVGRFADRSEKVTLKMIIVFFSAINIGLLAWLTFLEENLVLVTLVFASAIIFTLTLQPIVNSLAFAYVEQGITMNFSLARGVGSFSFATLSFVLGPLIDRYDPFFLPLVSIGAYIGLILLVLTFPKASKLEGSKNNVQLARESLLAFGKKYHRFLYFLLATTCLFTFMAIANTYLVQIILHLGGTEGDVGSAMGMMAIVEFPMMFAFAFLATKFSSSNILKFAGAAFVVRSVLFLIAPNLAFINIAQASNAFGFALFIPASVYYVDKLTNPEDKVRGQSLVVGAMTLGGVVGNFVGGWILDQANVPVLLTFGVGAAVLGCVLIMYSVRRE